MPDQCSLLRVGPVRLLQLVAEGMPRSIRNLALSDAQTAELIRRIAPSPVPSYAVPAPYPYCGTGYGYNNGCGCGC